MKIDKEMVMIFLPVLTALILCAMAPYLMREDKGFTPEQPEFLAYVDKLGMITVKEDAGPAPADIKDVFRHEWTMPGFGLPEQGGGAAPLVVSMVVEAGEDGFCIINGRKMHIGDKTDRFRVTSIGSDSVTLLYQNGTREIRHVKVY
jgi:hypothetical protein